MTKPKAAVIRGQDLKVAFDSACASLARHRDSINALNVFPVPDGDTGTNMLLTMRAATGKVHEGPDEADVPVDSVVARLADGAFWGARGNSGVILSQFFAGMALCLAGYQVCDGEGLESAFREGALSAYRSVGNPMEGTMLTVLAALAPAVGNLSGQGEESTVVLWEAAFNAALDALRSTPSLLPALKDAGVVDAGGLGVVVILGGVLDRLTGRSRLEFLVADLESQTPSPGSQATSPGDHASWGFCIQFVIKGENLVPEDIRRYLGVRFGAGTGDGSDAEQTLSAVVAGDEDRVRLHLHAPDPEPVLAYGRSLGQLQQVSVQDMDQQNHGFASGPRDGFPSQQQPALEIAVVAVASGDGLADLFRGTGCAAVAGGGQTMNPSVEQLLDSAGAAGAKEIILLPNNPNVIAAARQAATQNPSLHVVDTRSIPQGIAALLAFSPDKPLQENLDAMGMALTGVTSVEVTNAVRSATVNGLPVREGQSLAFNDGELVAAADSPEKAVKQALAKAGMGAGAFVTLYLGQQAGKQEAQELADQLRAQAAGIQVDLIYGGQPHYQYLASLE